MPSSSCEISSENSKVSHLVKLCGRKELRQALMKYVRLCDYYGKYAPNNIFFVSVALDPRKLIEVRGKKRQYNDCTVQNQYRWFKRRIEEYHKWFTSGKFGFKMDYMFWLPEHFKDGNVHYHFLFSLYDGEYVQNLNSFLKQLFDISRSKNDSIQINIKPVKCPTITLEYFLKEGTFNIECDHLNNSLEEWREYIKSKSYEVSKFDGGYFIHKDYDNLLYGPPDDDYNSY